MPLTRANVTRASRIMLPAYPIFSGWLGANYLLTPRDRLTTTPVFVTADAIAPMPAWGLAFLLVAGCFVLAMLTRHRVLCEVGLAVLAGLMVVWAVVFAAAIWTVGGSPAGPAWPLLIATSCVATLRSVDTREGTPT